MKGVKRIDRPDLCLVGYFARIKVNKREIQDYIPDASSGGPEAAYKIACERMIEMEREAKRPVTDRRIVKGISPTNKFGVPGVCETYRRLKNGERYYEIQAYWHPEPGKIRRKRFSVEIYGYDRAVQLAIETRKQAEKEIYGAEISRD